VLANILEGEGILKEAYIEEAKSSIHRFGKGIESAFNVAPMLQSFLEMQLYNNKENKVQKDKNNNLIAGTIFATGLFIGSSIALPHNTNIAYAGFIGSIVIVALFTVRKKFW
jgi:hypothetical protein